MTPGLMELLRAFTSAYRSGACLVLLFDYDGTLSPIVELPSLAELPPQTRLALSRLRALPRVHLGVLSGRQLSDLKGVLGMPGIFLAGTTGLELDFHGIAVTHPGAGNAAHRLRDVAAALEPLVKQFAGAWLERKRIGMTVHYRHVNSSEIDDLRLGVSKILEIMDSPRAMLRLVDSQLSLEITPDLGWTKGTAVAMLLDTLPSTHRMILFAGDGPNDLEAFVAVAERGGTGVGVGSGAPKIASLQAESPRELGKWLGELVMSLTRCSGVAEKDRTPIHASRV
jgi:trehalose-phosphatase